MRINITIFGENPLLIRDNNNKLEFYGEILRIDSNIIENCYIPKKEFIKIESKLRSILKDTRMIGKTYISSSDKIYTSTYSELAIPVFSEMTTIIKDIVVIKENGKIYLYGNYSITDTPSGKVIKELIRNESKFYSCFTINANQLNNILKDIRFISFDTIIYTKNDLKIKSK